MEKNYDVAVKNRISVVESEGIGQELGIEVGDLLVSINQRKVVDIIDYIYLLADEYVEVEIIKASGEHWILEIDKEYHEDLGIEFENPIMDQAKHCSNKCVFCFVDQLPDHMRKTLYFKDDDSRLSFLQGNFVTLTNLNQSDLERIVEYKISPLNVSIHATDPEARIKMLKNPNSGNLMNHLKYLVESGIEVNGQIVLCPGYNDREVLDQTIEDLKDLSPLLNSVAVVPVGITKYRDGLQPLEVFDQTSAKEVIERIEKKQASLLKTIGSRFVFLSDEFYMIGKQALPSYEAYEGFIQIENGVGLMRLFEYQLIKALKNKKNKRSNTPITIVTGVSAYEFMIDMANKVMEKTDVVINVKKIVNDFFGHSITVAGLVTGKDFINQMKDELDTCDLLIPDVMLRSGESVFLDDVTIEDIESALNRKIYVTKVEGQDFLDKILRR
jgi:putative radical SAM enzyme (TIGR03279 family)